MRTESALGVTVKTATLLVPAGVLIVTLRAPVLALVAMISWNVTKVGPACTILPTVTPVPEIAGTMSGVKFAPCTVTETVAPIAPLDGAIELVVGSGGMVMVNVTAALLSEVDEVLLATTKVCAPTDPPRPSTTEICVALI